MHRHTYHQMFNLLGKHVQKLVQAAFLCANVRCHSTIRKSFLFVLSELLMLCLQPAGKTFLTPLSQCWFPK